MPRSKRARRLALHGTTTKTRQEKAKMIELVRSFLPPKHTKIYVFEYGDIRNQSLKEFREEVKRLPEGGGRLFLGSNRVLQVALGRSPEDALAPELHQLGEKLRGKRGLLFCSAPDVLVQELFANFERREYARAGTIAPEDVRLAVGEPLEDLPASSGPKLRELGLPISLRGGRLFLDVIAGPDKHFLICSKGEILSAEQCVLLRMLGIRLATARLHLRYRWDAEHCKVEELGDQE
jgi:mRNA turnover protein 4